MRFLIAVGVAIVLATVLTAIPSVPNTVAFGALWFAFLLALAFVGWALSRVAERESDRTRQALENYGRVPQFLEFLQRVRNGIETGQRR
jgi:membrane protein implicated in regulation of membrane protease activity